MTLKERIEQDFKQAMKAKESLRLSCLRMVKSAVTMKEFEAKVKSLDDAGVMAVLNSLAKKAQESIEQFEKGGRPELAQKEKDELLIIRSYLPAALGEAELSGLVDEAIRESGAVGAKDMGKVMKALMPKVAGRADGKVLSALVQKKLQCILNPS